ncbi:site-specific integrase [uncultured Microbacterium sp.]|uniref:tyrosine-type recombinase/integrase n=1 Tax=uncultured Microbacterium sp. TaxID=191216 RepID=UPI0028EDCB33|nr:site-specific integrase [uncultured Microbacterium sp.]
MSGSHMRAPRGAGSIYLRKDGRYEATTRALTPGGGHKRVRVYGATRAEAHAKLHTIVDRTLKGIPEADRSWTVGDWLDHWLENSVKLRTRERTVELYEGLIRRYLKPNIGARRLKELSVSDFQDTINYLTRSGVGPRTIQQTRMVLSSALNRALRDELIHRNVARLVDLPKYTPKEIHPWTLTDAQAFLRAAQRHRWELGFQLLLTYGMRRGEVLGLRWQDIELGEGTIRIRQQIQRIQGELVAGPVKTDAGKRTLPLLPHIRELLSAASAERDESLEHDLIFTSTTGQPVEPGNFARAFQLLIEKAGLRRITVHQTRHTAATLLKSFGVQSRDVQLILGHSNVSTTEQLYQHGYIDEHREALQRVATALAGSVPGTPASVSVGVAADEISRQRRLISPSDTIEASVRQGTETNEERHLTEVEMADFLGGSGGTRTHDILLKSLISDLSADLPTSVLHHHHTRVRRLIFGAQAVKSCRQICGKSERLHTGQNVVSGSGLTVLRGLRDALHDAHLVRYQRQSFPLSLIPSTPLRPKEST